MIDDIKQAIVDKLKEIYPNITKRHTDDIPQKFSTPAFVVFQIDQDYSKRLNNKYKGRISFDIAYYSDKPTPKIKSDCFDKQEVLLKEFDIFGAYKALNKNAQITDNVLHITFDVNYSEIKTDIGVPMQSQVTNTNI